MKTLANSIKILVFFFIAQLVFSFIVFFSGCRCNNPVIPYNLDSLSIRNLYNADNFPTLTESNSMYSAAIAFSVTLADSNLQNPYYYTKCSIPATVGFTSSYATSMDCNPIFVPNQRIVGINIVTLYSINSAVLSGADVTNLFLARSNNYNPELMYSTFESLFVKLNSQPNEQPELNFNVFLKVPVVNTLARFALIVSLSDGTVLSDTTKLITVIPNP